MHLVLKLSPEQNKEAFQNSFFVIIWFLLLFLIPLSYLLPSIDFFFKPLFGWTLYGWLILVLTFETLLWGALEYVRRLPKRRESRPLMDSLVNIVGAFLVFVGFKKRSRMSEIVVGVVIGISLATSTVISRAFFESSAISVTNPMVILYLFFTRFEMWAIVLLISVLEEIIYRGLFTNRLVRVFSSNSPFAGAIAVISSSLVFGWTHLELPIYKTIAGLALGLVYLWGWRKNILATTVAHISANSLFFFFVLE